MLEFFSIFAHWEASPFKRTFHFVSQSQCPAMETHKGIIKSTRRQSMGLTTAKRVQNSGLRHTHDLKAKRRLPLSYRN